MKKSCLFGLVLLLLVSVVSFSGCGSAMRVTEDAKIDVKKSDSPSQAVTVNIVLNGSGSGVVGTNVLGRGCVESCSVSVDAGKKVYAAAVPGNGSLLLGWSGCDSVDGIVCAITTSVDKTITATFARIDS